MVALPRLPRAKKVAAVRPCACGCGRSTARTWFPGDDGRSVGWAIRVERGVVALSDIPVAGRAGALRMLTARGYFAALRVRVAA